MWQRPKSQAPSEGPWFTNAPLGFNTLGNKMKAISEKAGCSLIYTNHSLRATTVTVLDEAGVAGRDIMAVTGRPHKSESSLKHYIRTSNGKKQDMSTIISSQMQENIPVTREEPAERIFDDLVLTDSQEQFLF